MLALEAGEKSIVTAGVIAGEITVLDEKHRQKKVGNLPIEKERAVHALTK